MYALPALRVKTGLPGYKPVSVPLRAAIIRLGHALLRSSSDLPGSPTERATPPPLFDLAPRGVYLAGKITFAAVRSYRTISPLPSISGGGIFSVALSVSVSGPRPLAGTLPCGDRTFLPRGSKNPEAIAHPQPLFHCDIARQENVRASTRFSELSLKASAR